MATTVKINAQHVVDASGIMLGDIETSVKTVSDIIAQISAAGQEQADGIAQENKALLKMDEIAQQNAALARPNTRVTSRRR
jgi:methyl-accepting chemotaxis protein